MRQEPAEATEGEFGVFFVSCGDQGSYAAATILPNSQTEIQGSRVNLLFLEDLHHGFCLNLVDMRQSLGDQRTVLNSTGVKQFI
jgi:hypothetical protein